MSTLLHADICVIGAGSGGLSVAAGAAQLGARTVLIESGRMGGDCLNYGCVPSKSLLAAAHRAVAHRAARDLGVVYDPPRIDWDLARAHIRKVIADIAPHDSVARFEGLGVQVIAASARFIDRETVVAGDYRITARRFVLATGSQPAVPPIPGLDGVPYLTNETIFDVAGPVRHLLVIGGGPIGAELAQAHARLGARVTVLEMARLLAQDDPDLVAAVRASLIRDGVTLFEGARVIDVARHDGEIQVNFAGANGIRSTVSGSHLLVAAGRSPNLAALDLAAAGIAATDRGVTVDAHLRSSNRRVYAVGDCAGGPAFTHVAGYHAGIVIRNILFRLPARTDYRALPRVTYTDPELAVVGLGEAEARRQWPDCVVTEAAFADNDRARAEGETAGRIKVIARRNGRILGAALVGPRAGELLAPWCLAIGRGMKLSALAGAVLPYPTLGEISKSAAGRFYTPKLFSPWVRRLVGFLLRLP